MLCKFFGRKIYFVASEMWGCASYKKAAKLCYGLTIPNKYAFQFMYSTVKLHKHGPLLQTAGHPFPALLLGQPSSALLSTAQAGGPPSVKIGWATETIIFEDVRGHKMTSFFTCKFSGQFAVLGIFFSPCLLVKIIRNSPRKIGATK